MAASIDVQVVYDRFLDDPAVFEALLGSRAPNPDVTVGIDGPMGPAVTVVTFRLRRATVQGEPARAWAARALETLAAATAPVWGAAYTTDAYRAKVMADGRDFGRVLPGLFERNVFGAPYIALIGRERLLSAPAEVKPAGETIVMAVQDEAAVLDHLGREFFFATAGAREGYAAPAWPAPPLDALESWLRRLAPLGSEVEVAILDSGAFDVLVRRADGPVVQMQGLPHRGQYGLTPDLRGDDAGFDSGHPSVFEDYDAAINALLNAMRGAARPAPPGPSSA